MTHINAIYHDGVFKPLEPVNLQDQQRVRLTIQAFDKEYIDDWLAELDQLHASIKKRVGLLPDSAPDIAADRLRDV